MELEKCKLIHYLQLVHLLLLPLFENIMENYFLYIVSSLLYF